jgi:hypothetical protein
MAEIQQSMIETLVEHTSLQPFEIADSFTDVMIAGFRFDEAPNHLLAITWRPLSGHARDREQRIDLSTLRAHVFVYASSDEPYQRLGQSASSDLVKVTEAEVSYGLRGAYLDPRVQKEIRFFLSDLMQPLQHRLEGQERQRLRWIHKHYLLPNAVSMKSGQVWSHFLEAHDLACREQVGHQFDFFKEL